MLKIFGESHPFVNTEYTLPCKTKTVIPYDTSVFPAHYAGIFDTPRVIILPSAFERLASEQKEQVLVMSSAYECGRVLEINENIIIDGKPHTMTVKGVGSTRFSREVQTNPLIHGVSPRAAEAIRRFKDVDYPYFNREFLSGTSTASGMCPITDATEEATATGVVASLGIDTARILALQEILEMPDKQGRLRPVADLAAEYGFNLKPMTLLYRLMKSNFRLADLYMLREMGHLDELRRMLDHAKELFALHTGAQAPTIQDYFLWLVDKVASSSMRMALRGDLSAMDRWYILSCNISIMGEQVDIESDDYHNFLPYSMEFELALHRNAQALDRSLRMTFDIINSVYPEKVSPEAFADTYYTSMTKAMGEYPDLPETSGAPFDWKRVSIYSHYQLIIRATRDRRAFDFALADRISESALNPVKVFPNPAIDQ
jgi:hypothetical protein